MCASVEVYFIALCMVQQVSGVGVVIAFEVSYKMGDGGEVSI